MPAHFSLLDSKVLSVSSLISRSLCFSAGGARSPSGTKAPAPVQSAETGCRNGLKCEHNCIAYEGVPQCTCRDGYQLHMNGYSCVGE